MSRTALHRCACLLCALLLTGCLSTVTAGDRYFEANAFAKAAEAYPAEIQEGLHSKRPDRALYRLALAHLARDSPAFSPPAARQALEQLMEQYPRSSFAARSRTMLEWIEDSETLRAQLELEQRRSENLLMLVERLRGQLASAHAATAEGDRELADLYRQLDEQKRRQKALRSELATNGRRITELTRELEKIKAIDLEEPPRIP